MPVQIMFTDWCDQIIDSMQRDDFDPLVLEELVENANSAFRSEYFPLPDSPHLDVPELTGRTEEDLSLPFEVSYVAGHEIALLIRRQDPGVNDAVELLLLDADPTRQKDEQKSLLANVRVWKRWAKSGGTFGPIEVPEEYRQELDCSKSEEQNGTSQSSSADKAKTETLASAKVDCPPGIQKSIDDWNAGELTWKEIESLHNTDRRTIKRYAERTGQKLRLGNRGRRKKNRATPDS